MQYFRFFGSSWSGMDADKAVPVMSHRGDSAGCIYSKLNGDNRLCRVQGQVQLNLSLNCGQLHIVMESLWVCTCGSQIKRVNHWHFPFVFFVFTVAVWLDDTQTMRFHCACCWHEGQRGVAWQCLTLGRFRAGGRDQHHEAQLTTEPRA